MGIVARVGELPGEYCAGEWSVNAAGVKLAGTAQRSIRGASLVTAMLIVEGGARLRAALVDVYAALEIAGARRRPAPRRTSARSCRRPTSSAP